MGGKFEGGIFRSKKAVQLIGRFYVVIYVYILGFRRSSFLYASAIYVFLLQKLSFNTKREFRLTIGFYVIVYIYIVGFRLSSAGYKYTMYACLLLDYNTLCVVGLCVLFVYCTCMVFVYLLGLGQGTVQCTYTSGEILLSTQVVCISGFGVNLVYGALLCTCIYLLAVVGLNFGKILQNFTQILQKNLQNRKYT